MTSKKSTSTFDKWMKEGKFNGDAFRRSQLQEAVDSFTAIAHGSIRIAPTKKDNVVDNESLIAWLAKSAHRMGVMGKAFAQGKRQIVYFATSYVLGLSSTKEKNVLLKNMPTLFGYSLGKTPSKAWRDILSHCNTYGPIARAVGHGSETQKTLQNVSKAITQVCYRFASPTDKRKVVIAWFNDHYRQNNGFGDSTTVTALEKLYLENHASVVDETHDARRAECKRLDTQDTNASKAIAGSGNKSFAELDDFEQGRVFDILKDRGIPTDVPADLRPIAKIMRVDFDVASKDAIGLLDKALDTLLALTESFTQKRLVASNRKETKRQNMPTVNLSIDETLQSLKFTPEQNADFSAYGHAIAKLDGNKAIVTFHNGKEVHSVGRSEIQFYTLRKAVKLDKVRPMEFRVNLTA